MAACFAILVPTSLASYEYFMAHMLFEWAYACCLSSAHHSDAPKAGIGNIYKINGKV